MKVRDVTQVQASWTEQERERLALYSPLILDNGVDEYVLRPTPDDAKVLLELLQRSDHATFDLGRKVLMFSNLSVELLALAKGLHLRAEIVRSGYSNYSSFINKASPLPSFVKQLEISVAIHLLVSKNALALIEI